MEEIVCQKTSCVVLASQSSYGPVLLGAVFGFVSGILAFLLTRQLSEWKNRKDICTLGAIIINEIQEERATGISLMRSLQGSVTQQSSSSTRSGLLPTSSWAGMSTIPDNVILRIVAMKPLPIIKVRSDCKNYFEHICGNINSRINAGSNNASIAAQFIAVENSSNYLVAATNLYDALDQIRVALIKNSRKLLPK